MRSERVFFTIIIIFAVVSTFAQPGANPYSARIIITKGNNVDFIFNTFNKYKNGITYNNWTTVAIAYKNPDDPSDTWKLTVEANTSTIEAEIGSINLPLSILQIRPESIGSKLPTFPVAPTLFTLSSSPVKIVGGGQQGNEKENIISLSYECGVANPIPSNAPSIMYNVDIIFTLSSEK